MQCSANQMTGFYIKSDTVQNTGLKQYYFGEDKYQHSHYTETSQLICSANYLTGFYMMGALVFWLMS